MILYKVRNGVITAESVVRETKCGWRTHIGGFYNKCRMGRFIHLDETYLTTNYEEALTWQKRTIGLLNDIIQVSRASKSDIDFWIEIGSDEGNIPDSRYVVRDVRIT
jgi:hypothetical protein